MERNGRLFVFTRGRTVPKERRLKAARPADAIAAGAAARRTERTISPAGCFSGGAGGCRTAPALSLPDRAREGQAGALRRPRPQHRSGPRGPETGAPRVHPGGFDLSGRPGPIRHCRPSRALSCVRPHHRLTPSHADQTCNSDDSRSIPNTPRRSRFLHRRRLGDPRESRAMHPIGTPCRPRLNRQLVGQWVPTTPCSITHAEGPLPGPPALSMQPWEGVTAWGMTSDPLIAGFPARIPGVLVTAHLYL